MIELLLACVLSSSPLAITGNESGLWFIGDVAPNKSSFTARAKDLDFDLCQQYGENEYVVVVPFTRRPSLLAVEENKLWFVDASSGVGLYTVKLANANSASTSRNAMLRMPTLQSLYKTTEKPTGLLVLEEEPVLVFDASGENATTLVQYKNKEWTPLPSINGSGAKVTLLRKQLIAAVPIYGGVSLWYFQEGSWLGGDKIEIDGALAGLICKDNWPILITNTADEVTMTGIQQGGPVHLATFPLPKGRWGAVPTSKGITVVGVQRKGIFTSFDIGWPSGTISGPIILNERIKKDDSLLFTVLFLSMVLASLLLISKIRRPVQKN